MNEMLKYKPYLKELNYPNINIFSDEEILDIFTAENRHFFLTWLVKNIHPELAQTFEGSTSSEDIFADYFNANGFCRPSEKLAFVRGSENLTGKKLMDIFDRIFIFIQMSSPDKNGEPILNVLEEDAELKDITDSVDLLLKKNINLFSTSCPLKLRTAEEKLQKMNYYTQEIEKLQKKVNFHRDNEINFEEYCKDVLDEEIRRNIEQLRKQAWELQKAAAVAGVHDKYGKSDNMIGFKSNLEEQLSECNSEIRAALQYAKTVQLSQLVDIPVLEDLQLDEIHGICEQQTQDTFEVVKRMNTNNQK